MRKLSTSVKSTKKAIQQLCTIAKNQGFKVEHKIKDNVDNIYIANKLIAEVFPGYAGIIINIRTDKLTPEQETKVMNHECPECGSELVIRDHHKTGIEFIGCTNFPQCRFTAGISLW